MKKPLRIVILGMVGQVPVAGMAWQALHYIEGFRRLGHDVYYVEDTGDWPYDPEQNAVTGNCRYTVQFLTHMMTFCGMGDRWAYRSAADQRTYGVPERQLSKVLEETDIIVNLGAATVLRPEHFRVPVRIYLETDPVLPQIRAAKGCQSTLDLLGAHTHHFTFAENLGAPDCGVPSTTFDYHRTRQPVVLDWWRADTISSPDADSNRALVNRFTTIANWRQSGKDVEWNGQTYTWSKHIEFLKFLDSPGLTGQPLELALVRGDSQTIRLLASHGWSVASALAVSKDILTYRDYILASRGEFTVAKDQNVRLRSGWFSDRSASYLAAGRPVITQDTGFGKFFPTGDGLFSFTTMDEIVAAMEAINSDYARHSLAARAIAEKYFRAETVLAELIENTGL